jgi:hypothetical protein
VNDNRMNIIVLLGVLWCRPEYLFLVRHFRAHHLFHVGGLLGFSRMTKNGQYIHVLFPLV